MGEVFTRTRCQVSGCKSIAEVPGSEQGLLPSGWFHFTYMESGCESRAIDTCPVHGKVVMSILAGKKKPGPKSYNSKKSQTSQEGVQNKQGTASAPPVGVLPGKIRRKKKWLTEAEVLTELNTMRADQVQEAERVMAKMDTDPLATVERTSCGVLTDPSLFPDPLATLRIRTPVSDDENYQITMNGVTVRASTLKMAVVRLFKETHGISGDKLIIERLNTYPISAERDRLLAILTA